MNFEQELKNKVEKIEQIIKAYLPQCTSEKKDWAKTVIEAMNYSVNVGGKRLRPLLMAETYSLFGGADKVIEPFMAAIEMIHTYSLVHDDLPAMDNDLYRRGKKTTWAVYGEAMAILAGDGLLNIHAHKTAALIQAAMMVGAVLAGADEEQITLVERAAYEIGIAFQIQDDILDVTSTLETLGKPVGSDAKNLKRTYVTLKGITEASQEQKEFSNHAIKLLNSLEEKGIQNEFLVKLIRSLITRVK